jgi:shikimate dehydrogenase
VLGTPIAHSLSPVIHTAGFAAAGLSGWSYTAIECDQDALPALVAGLDEQWAGLSLTMPLKEVGLTLAAEASPVAAALGAANTLVRRPDGTWFADNTDAPGMVRVLRDAGVADRPRVTVLGAGGTARAALAAAAALGSPQVTLVARRPEAAVQLAGVAAALDVAMTAVSWDDAPAALDNDVVVCTVPKGVADPFAAAVRWRSGGIVFDALYDPWPTPVADAAAAAGARVVSGLDLLLAQALSQFEQFTGVCPAPETAMRDALLAAATRS